MFTSPTVKLASVAVFIVGYLGAEALVWATQVPGRMTAATFAWASSLGLLLTGIALVTSMRGRATRTIAHVLYDTEHPDSTI
jgi:hypothetical protein